MKARALENCCLNVEFTNGQRKKYDIKQLFARYPQFRLLEIDADLFSSVKVNQGGYGIFWNEDLDLSADELYENGETVSSSL